ncbi:DUF3899 domain-containing protein [Ectobacillus antri]|uniref:DUF3899 domain-containing protein n=1 Tax=Ectobacillus antri TaxID=2486280 RepID=A0ABT6H5N7_9BACI|nr:DUF3899 domain-containing protein [Ectobacillus antri]MDG4656657.1 DUF3899 domain-containing protein [Ectobacillus antri]MDG5753980.1 DUF3899 domain-containing protein [Ectobacillus antri]
MKRTYSLFGWLIGSSLLVVSILAFLAGNHDFLLNFVDFSFLVALPFLIVGGFMFIIERGAFNVTRYAFRKVFKTTQKESAFIEDEEGPLDNKDILYRTYSFKPTYPILLTGVALAILSTLLSFLFFV